MTTQEILERRTAIITEARSWVGTPYRLGNPVKKAGADCSTFIYGVYRSLDLVPDEQIGVFAQDWYCHTDEDKYFARVKYLLQVRRHAYKTAEAVAYRSTKATAGSIVLVKANGSAKYNHGGIVTAWPRI